MYVTFRSDEQSEWFSAASPPIPAAQESTETDPAGPPRGWEREVIKESNQGNKKKKKRLFGQLLSVSS